MGYAISRDGVHWTRYPLNPILENNAGGIDVTRIEERLDHALRIGSGDLPLPTAAWSDLERPGTLRGKIRRERRRLRASPP
ncbi:MAG: hypothetical protein R3C11_23450 [Planctomycetaceae bacterium]